MKINLVKNAAKRLYLKSRRAATYKNSNNLLARRAIHDIEIWKGIALAYRAQEVIAVLIIGGIRIWNKYKAE